MASMNHATRIKIASGVTALTLAGLTAVGLATRSADRAPASAPAQASLVSQSVATPELQTAVASLPASLTTPAPAAGDGQHDGGYYEGGEYD